MELNEGSWNLYLHHHKTCLAGLETAKQKKIVLTDCVPLALGLPRPFFSTAVDPSSDILLNLI